MNMRLVEGETHVPGRWQESSRWEYQLGGGGKIIVRAVELDEKKWLQLSSSELSQRENDRHLHQWDFEVAGYVYSDFIKTLDDLLAPPPAVVSKEPSAAF